MTAVSVIVPNYNHADFLRQRIDSVLNQEYQDFELIILDDASTDNSLQVIGDYVGDPRVKLLVNKVNSGSPFAQWNRGANEARGKYLWIAESDDYCKPELLKTLVGLLDRYPDAGLAYCQSICVDEKGHERYVFNSYEIAVERTHFEQDYFNEGIEELKKFLLYCNTIPNASAVVFRRDLFSDMGGASEALKLCGDWLTWGRLLSRSDIAFVSEPLNYYRLSPETSQRQKAKRDGLDIIEGLSVFRELSSDQRITDDEWEMAFRSHISRWAYYASVFRFPFRLNQQIYRKFRQSYRGARVGLLLIITMNFCRQLAFRVTDKLQRVTGSDSHRANA